MIIKFILLYIPLLILLGVTAFNLKYLKFLFYLLENIPIFILFYLFIIKIIDESDITLYNIIYYGVIYIINYIIVAICMIIGLSFNSKILDEFTKNIKH